MLWACCCSYILACLDNNNRNAANSTELLSGSLSLPAVFISANSFTWAEGNIWSALLQAGPKISTRVPVPGRSCRKGKCQWGQWPCGSFLQGFLLRSALWFIFSPFPSAPLPSPFRPTAMHVLFSLYSFLSSPLHIICPFPFSPPLVTEMHASFPIPREESIKGFLKRCLTSLINLMYVCIAWACLLSVCVCVCNRWSENKPITK